MKETRFKQTEVGMVPLDWEISNIETECNVTTGSKNTQDKEENGIYPFFVRSDKIERINSYSYNCEAVLTAGDGVGTGKVFHYVNGKFEVHQRVYIIKDFSDKLDGMFFYLYFSNNFLGRIKSMTAKSSVDSVRKDMITKMRIPLPQIKEQQKISAALTSIDNLLLSLEKLIEKKKLIKQGAMQKLLTGKKRLPGFTEKWQGFSIGELGETYNGITGKSAKDFGHGKAKYITFLNVLANTRINTTHLEKVDIKDNEKQNAVKCGDLFFNTSSETPEEVGMCSAITQDIDNTYLNSFCFGFRLYNTITVSPLFLAYWFRTKQGRSLMSFLAQGSTRYNLSKDGFKKGVVSLPSYEEQNAIVEILTIMDDEIASLEAKREKYVSIKQGMMQQLLTGKVRLF